MNRFILLILLACGLTAQAANPSFAQVTNIVNSRIPATGEEFSLLTPYNASPIWADYGEGIIVNDSFGIGASIYGGSAFTAGGGSSGVTVPSGFADVGWYWVGSKSTNAASYGMFRYCVASTANLVWQSNVNVRARAVLGWSNNQHTNTHYGLGLFSAYTSLVPNDGILWKARHLWTTNWIAAIGVGGNWQYWTSSLPASPSVLHNLGIIGTTNRVSFLTNGSVFVTCDISTNALPGGIALMPGFRSMCSSTVNGNGAQYNTLHLDKFQAYMK